MFNNAISDIIDLNIKDLDKSENGIYGRLNSVNEILVVRIDDNVGCRADGVEPSWKIKNRSFLL